MNKYSSPKKLNYPPRSPIKNSLPRSSSCKRPLSNSRCNDCSRCDTPDRGGGNPEHLQSLSKVSQSSTLEARKYKQLIENSPEIKTTSPSLKSNRSQSLQKNCQIDLRPGAFSIKQSLLKPKYPKKLQNKEISNNWRQEVRSPNPISVLPGGKGNQSMIVSKETSNNSMVHIKGRSEALEALLPWQRYMRELGNIH